MSELIKCKQCGTLLAEDDRFCGNCGFDNLNIATVIADDSPTSQQPKTDVTIRSSEEKTTEEQQMVYSSDVKTVPENRQKRQAPAFEPSMGYSGGSSSQGTKSILVVLAAIVLIAAGAGLYWYLSKPEGGPSSLQMGSSPVSPADTAEMPEVSAPGTSSPAALTQPETYLPEPDLKCTYYQHFPDGDEGTVERITGQVNSNAVVSDVELFVDGSNIVYGSASHYIIREDGVYNIFDEQPQECMIVLQRGLKKGMKWSYHDEFGDIEWTVKDMGVSCDLACGRIENCLVLETDNQACGVKELNYYAPGLGVILSKAAPDGMVTLELKEYQSIDKAQAQANIIQYAPNYQIIKDDRSVN